MPRALSSASTSPIRSMMTGASPSVGSSSSSILTPVRSMRAMASICCSPPESLVPWLARRSFEVREERVDLVDAQAALGDDRRQHQVLLHRQASRRCRAPRARSRCRRARCGAAAAASGPGRRSVMVPVRLRTMPMMARSVVVLPTPLRPRSVTVSPRPTARSTPCRTWLSPYQAFRPATSSSGSGIGGPHVGLAHLRVAG